MLKAALLLSLLHCLLLAEVGPVAPDLELTPKNLAEFKELFPRIVLVKQPRNGELGFIVSIHAPKSDVSCAATLFIVEGEIRSVFHLDTTSTYENGDTLVAGRITADLAAKRACA